MKNIKRLGLLTMALCIAILAVSFVGGGMWQTASADGESEFVIDENNVLTKYNGTDATVTVPETVVAIGASAFAQNRNIVKVILPEGCKTINEYAFRYCSKLVEINLDNVETIGNGAFESAKLEKVHFGTAMRTLGTGAFAYNTSLIEVTMDEGLETIGASAFISTRNLKKIDLASTVTSFGTQCFASSGIESITIPEGITALAARMFQSCSSLKDVKLPSTLKTIGGSAFSSCMALAEVALNEGLEEIDSYAFQSSGIKKVHIPSSVKDLGDRDTYVDSNGKEQELYNFAYYYCRNIESFTVAEGNEYYSAENNILYNKDFSRALMFATKAANTTITLNENCKMIQDSAFAAAANITSVVINEGCEIINYNAFMEAPKLVSVDIPSTIKEIRSGAFAYTLIETIELPEGLTHLGSEAGYTGVFAGCEKLTGIEFPATLTYLGKNTFQNCKSITEITLPAFLTGYPQGLLNGCTSLTAINVEEGSTVLKSDNGVLYSGTELLIYPAGKTDRIYLIPETTTKITASAFANNANIVYVNIPESVIEIGSNLFQNCTALTTVDMQAQLETLPSGMFRTSGIRFFDLPDSVKIIGSYAFFGCKELKTLDLKNITTIQSSAFSNSGITEIIMPDTVISCQFGIAQMCTELTTVRLSAAFSTIPGSMFYGCTKLEEIIIPEGIQVINGYTFSDLPALKEINLPKSITSINTQAFMNMTGLVAYNIDPENTVYKSVDGVLYNYEMTQLMFFPLGYEGETFEIPATVTELPNYVFKGTGLKSIVVPANVKKIGSYAFQNCTQLESVTLSEGIEFIGFSAFSNCAALKEIVIPASVTSIDMGVFQDCVSLVSVEYKGTPCYSESLFRGCTSLTYFEFAEGTERVPQYILADCTGIKEIRIASSVKTIETNAFLNCKGVETLLIGANVNYIEPQAFMGMSNLKAIAVYAETAPTLAISTWVTTGDHFVGIAENPVLYIVEGATGYVSETEEKTAWENTFTIVELKADNFKDIALAAEVNDSNEVVLTWNVLAWAECYDLYVNGELLECIKDNTATFTGVSGEVYNVRLVAVAPEGYDFEVSFEVEVQIEFTELEKAIQDLEKALNDLEAANKSNSEKAEQIESLEGQLAALRAELEASKVSNEAYLAQIAQLEAEIAQLKSSSADCNGSVATTGIAAVIAIMGILAVAILIVRKRKEA